MDDRRFDSLTKALASGRSRRSVLKGLLGLGGAAAVGSTLLEPSSEAARRPTPTPKPLTCPGNQTPVGGQCVCQPPKAIGPYKCGPACCTGQVTDAHPAAAGHSECCDNACCFGTCYGEELCCPTNLRPGGLDPTHVVCDGPAGPTCFEGTCCNDSDCDDPFCEVCDLQTHTCGPRCDEETEVCCTLQAGAGRCQLGTCCPGAPCPETGQLCCIDDDVATCVATGECCTVDADCDNGCLACVDGACIPQCTRQECCTIATDRADWFCVEEGQCCISSDCSPASPPGCEVECEAETHLCRSLICLEGQICCRDDAGYGNCTDGRLCPCVDDDDCPDCQVCAQGTCVPGSGGESCIVFADDDDEDSGYCCDGQCLPADQVCNGGTCCPDGFCDGEGNCCPAGNIGCNRGTCCDGFCDGEGECCPAGNFPCNGGTCCSVECDRQGDCPNQICDPACAGDDECVACVNGVCTAIRQGASCNEGAGICEDVWCTSPDDPCFPGCAGDDECVECDVASNTCNPINPGLPCNEGAGICEDVWCVTPPECTDFCCSLQDCIDNSAGDDECMQCVGGECVPDNAGDVCNGGAGTCVEGWCV